jgi:hypothetical protein
MTRASVALGAIAIVLLLLAVVIESRTPDRVAEPTASPTPATTPWTAPPAPVQTRPAAQTLQGFLYGRVTAAAGAVYEGRLRWGRDQEAFWNDYFNGARREDPWLAHVPPELVPEQRRARYFLGFRIGEQEGLAGRLFMVRFGEIARIDARGRVVQVALKGGTVVELERFEASDFDDGVRVWDGKRGVVDVGSAQIRSVELLPAPALAGAPYRLHGSVRTGQGEFTGFVQWDREECTGAEELDGRTPGGEVSLRFDTIRSIARHSQDAALVTLVDGREVVLSDTNDVNHENRGISVDDPRYGRVTISWQAFERVDFEPGGSGPAYGDFPPGRPITGSVTTRSGRRLAGRLVYDLEESLTSETLDGSFQNVDYTLPFGLIASIESPGREQPGARPRVTLRSEEELQLDLAGDLGEGNAGMLVFVAGRERPEYVPWSDVARVDFDPLPATSSRLGPTNEEVSP